MRGWVRTGFYVGGMLVVTWIFGVTGQHTPFGFVLAAVGCTGLGLTIGCGQHAWDQRDSRP